MEQNIIIKLSKLNIFKTTTISEEQYASRTNNDRYVYVSAQDYGKDDDYYRRIDTYNLSNEEINLLLKIYQTKNIRTIKNVAIFFAVLTAISLAISIIGATSIASLF